MVATIEIVLDAKDVLQSPILQSVTDAKSANLQNYKGDLADLSVYFVVVNNEYGEQNEIELVEGGRDIQVTNSNVINYIYKVAHHRLNSQVAICLLSHCLVLWVIEMVSL
jgi:hypothetical protein